jgi:hypothetical protein
MHIKAPGAGLSGVPSHLAGGLFAKTHIAAQLTSLNFPAHFFIQLIIAQGMLVLLMIFITTKQPRYAAYLLISATAVSVVALATDVTDVGLLLGESLPFYAAIFILTSNGAFAVRTKESSSVGGSEPASGSWSKSAA